MASLESCLETAEIKAGPLFRKVNRGGKVEAGLLTPDAVRPIVLRRTKQADTKGTLAEPISPHGRRAGFVTTAYPKGVHNLVLNAHVADGPRLLTVMQEGPVFGGMSAMSVAELPHGAQDASATIMDFVRDCIDVFDVASPTEILSYGDTLSETIAELKKAGFCLSAAFRDVKLKGKNCLDKTPLPCRITYFLASSSEQTAAKLAVRRKVSMGL